MKVCYRVSLLYIIICLFGGLSIVFGQVKRNFNDTTVLKHLKWIKLNDYVSYYIINPGSPLKKPNSIAYNFETIAAYQYYKKGFEFVKKDISVSGNSEDMTKLVLASKFSEIRNFDAIFKVNSKAMFIQAPEKVFQKLGISPKSSDKKQVLQLMSKLKNESFVSNVYLDTFKMFKKLNGYIQVFLNIKLKPKYMNENKVIEIRKKLKSWPEIDSVVSSMDMFQGYNEMDAIYHITSL